MHGKTLTADELRTLILLAKKALWADSSVRESLQRQGLNITPASFYSPIPMLSDLADGFEYAGPGPAAPYDDGRLFRLGRIKEFADKISGFATEFDPPLEGNPTDPRGFFWHNPAFSRLDAMAYYCVLRHVRPDRVLEVGAGYSTFIADQALRKNGNGEIVVVEPYPKAFLRSLGTVSRLIEQPVQSIPVSDFVRLVESCQVWFIDSTHTVKAGSDCLYLYLKVMPYVTSPILCHTHDVFLPYGMPQHWLRDMHVYWTEQYLLQAYLLDNPKAEILFGSYYLYRQQPDLAAAMMHGRYESGGGSIWYSLNHPE